MEIVNEPTQITVSPDEPIGKLLTNWKDSNAQTNLSACTIPPPSGGSSLIYTGAGQDTGIRIDGLYPVYSTNIPKIGIALKARGEITFMRRVIWGGWNERMALPRLAQQDAIWSDRSMVIGIGGMVGYALVKTDSGPVTAGSIGPEYSKIDVHPVAHQIPAPEGTYPPWYFQMSPIRIVPTTCQTPQYVPVTMGTVSGSAFHGPGTAAPAKAFSITLQNCPAGFSTIQYTIHPTNPILDPINAVIGLLQGGATGVGLQLLDGQNNPVPLNRAVTVPGYTPGSSTVDIPLQAAYYQTAPAITSGRADAAVDFTITYE